MTSVRVRISTGQQLSAADHVQLVQAIKIRLKDAVSDEGDTLGTHFVTTDKIFRFEATELIHFDSIWTFTALGDALARDEIPFAATFISPRAGLLALDHSTVDLLSIMLRVKEAAIEEWKSYSSDEKLIPFLDVGNSRMTIYQGTRIVKAMSKRGKHEQALRIDMGPDVNEAQAERALQIYLQPLGNDFELGSANKFEVYSNVSMSEEHNNLIGATDKAFFLFGDNVSTLSNGISKLPVATIAGYLTTSSVISRPRPDKTPSFQLLIAGKPQAVEAGLPNPSAITIGLEHDNRLRYELDTDRGIDCSIGSFDNKDSQVTQAAAEVGAFVKAYQNDKLPDAIAKGIARLANKGFVVAFSSGISVIGVDGRQLVQSSLSPGLSSLQKTLGELAGITGTSGVLVYLPEEDGSIGKQGTLEGHIHIAAQDEVLIGVIGSTTDVKLQLTCAPFNIEDVVDDILDTDCQLLLQPDSFCRMRSDDPYRIAIGKSPSAGKKRTNQGNFIFALFNAHGDYYHTANTVLAGPKGKRLHPSSPERKKGTAAGRSS
jgi:hypothetical protein